MDTSYQQYYDLEGYLFNVVSPRFEATHTLAAFDFFCIVIWKANRSKSRVTRRLMEHGAGDVNLEYAVDSLIAAIVAEKDPRAKLSVLIEAWCFRLPIASAVLTVLYPNDFTVYDVRVCEVLKDF